MRELLIVKNDTKGILRKPSKPVKTIGPKVIEIAQDLMDYMYDHREDGVFPVSIAAPQLGESIRVIAFYPNHLYKERDSINILINPELVKTRKLVNLTETCLNLPGKKYTVRRASLVKVRGLNLDGKLVTYRAHSLFAQALQHEINHLDGILIDKIGEEVKGG